MAFVLCTGADHKLLQSRSMVLQKAGHVVLLATGEQELLAIRSGIKFDVAIIGQAMSPPQKQRMMRIIKERFPGTKVLELVKPFQGKILPDADDWMESNITPPTDLVQRVATLTEDASDTCGGS